MILLRINKIFTTIYLHVVTCYILLLRCVLSKTMASYIGASVRLCDVSRHKTLRNECAKPHIFTQVVKISVTVYIVVQAGNITV